MRERDARERFARAVEGGGDRSEAEEFGDELTVVASLRRAGMGQEADDETRHNVAARISSKLAEPEHHETSDRSRRRVLRPAVLRPALVAASFLLASFGVLALLSEEALPGEALYPVERAREATTLALTFDESERAEQQLSYAEQRVDELARIAENDVRAGRESVDYKAGLTDFDGAVRAAAAALTTLATSSGGSQLDILDTWAAEQAAALEDLTPALPGTAAERQERSLALLERVGARADSLRERFDCYRITSGQTDELGVLPATGNCVPPRSAPTQPPATSPAPAVPPKSPPDTPRETGGEDESELIEASNQVRGGERQPTTDVAALTTGTRPQRQPLSFEQVEPLPTPAPPLRPRLPEGAGAEVPPTVPAQLSEAVGGLLDTVR